MSLLLGIVGLAVFGVFVYQLSRNVLFGLYCLLAISLISIGLDIGQITIGGLHLDGVDFVSLGLLTAGVVRFLHRVNLPGRTRLIILAYLIIFSASLFRGMALFGVQAASNEARGFVGAILAMVYFFTAPTDSAAIKKILTAYLYFGSGLVIIAVLHYTGLNVAMPVLDDKDRALPSASGEVIALCFFVGLGWITHRKSPQILRWLLPVFAGMAILLQHRTVWTVMAVCSMSVLFIDFKLVRRLVPFAVLTTIVAIGLAIAIYGTGREATAQFEDSATNSGTWFWRVEAWKNSITDEDQTIWSVIFGQPIGNGFVRFDSDTGGYENLPPHSEYVVQYLRVGIVGLVFYLAFLLRPFLGLYELQRKDPLVLFPSASVWCVIVIGVVVYGITYGFDASAIALVGVANAVLQSRGTLQTEHSKHSALENEYLLPLQPCEEAL